MARAYFRACVATNQLRPSLEVVDAEKSVLRLFESGLNRKFGAADNQRAQRAAQRAARLAPDLGKA